MPFNLLLFPLIGGYLFLVFFNRSKYHHQRIDRQKLIFNSAAVGLILLLVAYFISKLVDYIWPAEITWIENNLYPDLQVNYLGTTLLACLLGLIAAFIGNKIWPEKTSLLRVIHKDGTLLEKFLYKALREKSSVMITMQSGKVYVGWILDIHKPSHKAPEERHIILQPLLSGYRNVETLDVRLKTDYRLIYTKANNEMREKFKFVFKINDITSIIHWDPEIYKKFNTKGGFSTDSHPTY